VQRTALRSRPYHKQAHVLFDESELGQTLHTLERLRALPLLPAIQTPRWRDEILSLRSRA
jgi:hypothetical protein